MREGIKIREIKNALRLNKMLAEAGMKTTGPTPSYIVGEGDWGTYDSALKDFGVVFYRVLPKDFVNPLKKKKLETEYDTPDDPEIFEEYIEQTLSKEKKQDLTAVEFGGPGSNLFSGFRKNFFKKTAGVCLKDIRPEDQKETDKKNKHSVIVGDIMDPINKETLTKVTQTLGAKKIDLIISKMEGPLDYIYKNPAILDRIIRNWYNMLNENGLMFIQFQTLLKNLPDDKPLVEKWAKAIKDRFPEVDIQVSKEAIRLHKKAGAPESLRPATQLFRE